MDTRESISFVENFISFPNSTELTRIKETINDLFIELDGNKFSTILSSCFLQKTYKSLELNKKEINTLGNGRSNLKRRKELYQSIEILNKSKNYIYKTYPSFLVNEKEFKNSTKENLQLEKTCNDILYNEVTPYEMDIKHVKKLSSEIQETYNELFKEPLQLEYNKSILTKFLKELDIKLGKLNIYLIHQRELLENEKKKYNNHNKEKITKLRDDEAVILINLKGENLNNCISLDNEIIFFENKKETLNNLYNNLFDTYEHFQIRELIKTKGLTVFGDNNIDILESIYEEISIFLDITLVTKKRFIDVFLISNIEPTTKINLTNGTLNDFGYLINKIKFFFVDDYKKKYNRWWSERFTFNNNKKNPKAVSNMTTSFKNQGNRQPTETAASNKIEEILNSSYNRPT